VLSPAHALAIVAELGVVYFLGILSLGCENDVESSTSGIFIFIPC
jgi:hypothetical protein